MPHVLSVELRITYDIINKQSFACFPESPTHVTYRARLEGTSETDSGFLMSLIEEWVSDGSSIVMAGVLMTVNSECSVAIPSLTEGGCSPATVSTMTTNGGTVTSTAIIGGVVAAILIIAIIIAVVIAVVLIIKNHGKVSIKKVGECRRGVGKGGAGGAVAPPLFEKGGHSPPTFWAVICINCLYLLSNASYIPSRLNAGK